MATEFKSQTLVHRDGRERTVTTPRELVAAKFDGFGEKRAVAKAAKAAGAKAPRKAAAKKAATPKAAVAPTDTSAAAEVNPDA